MQTFAVFTVLKILEAMWPANLHLLQRGQDALAAGQHHERAEGRQRQAMLVRHRRHVDSVGACNVDSVGACGVDSLGAWDYCNQV